MGRIASTLSFPPIGGSKRRARTLHSSREMRDEHRAIEVRVASLGELLKELGAGEPRAEPVAQALQGLESLADSLVAHFAGEESPEGLFAQALAAAPQLDRRVVALQKQHEPLGDALRRIVEDAGYAGLSGPAWRRVADAFESFANELRTHELAENQIASDAYLEDLGAGD